MAQDDLRVDTKLQGYLLKVTHPSTLQQMIGCKSFVVIYLVLIYILQGTEKKETTRSD